MVLLDINDEFKKKKTHPGKNHPTYIYKKEGDEYIYVGITHAEVTNNTKNIKLEKNPNPNDNRPAYYIPQQNKEKVSNFGRKYPNWKMSEKDKKDIRKLKK